MNSKFNVSKNFECHITIDNDITVITALQQHCSLTVAKLKDAIDKGALWLTRGKSTQRCRRIKKVLKASDQLHFYYNETVLSQKAEAAILLSDQNAYSVWYKPYGMLSQGSKYSDHCTITRWAQKNIKPERAVFPVHRLDKAASGIIIVAHTKSAARKFSHTFEQHQLQKHYVILVHGDHRSRPQPDTISIDVEQKQATSHFTCLAYDHKFNVSKIAVLIETGRKHQIRIHAASIGYPVVGDRLHGILQNEKNEGLNHLNDLTLNLETHNNLQLCAVKLSFQCPLSGQLQTFELDENMQPSIEKLTS